MDDFGLSHRLEAAMNGHPDAPNFESSDDRCTLGRLSSRGLDDFMDR